MNVSSVNNDQTNKKNKNKKQTNLNNRSTTTPLQQQQQQQKNSQVFISSSKQHLNNITNHHLNSNANQTVIEQSKLEKVKHTNDNKFSSLYYVSPKSETNNKKDSNFQRKTDKPIEKNKTADLTKKTLINKTKKVEKSSETQKIEENIFKNKENKAPDIRARYWAYLFDNLKRAVDEIYQTCENDNSISECKEVILVLENCTNDFRSLINRIVLMKDFEKANSNNTRLNSLAWEVRKSSPKKISPSDAKINTTTNAKLAQHLLKCNKIKEPFATGFQEFLPIYNTYDDDDEDDDEVDNDSQDDDDADDDDDENDEDFEENYKFKQKNDVNSMDMLNHETFSDMQSINTDDISLNTLSITPPPTSNSTVNLQQPQIMPFLLNKTESVDGIPSIPMTFGSNLNAGLFSLHSQKFQNSNDFQQSLFISNLQAQFNKQQQQNSRLANMTAQDLTNFMSLPTSQPPITNYSNYSMSNKMFNYQTFVQNPSDLNMLNNYENNHLFSLASNNLANVNYNNLLLNDSFESGSALGDNSFRLNRMEENLNNKNKNYNFKDSDFKFDLILDEDEEDEDLDDYFGNENFPDYDEFNYDDFTYKLVKKKTQQQQMQLATDKSSNLLKQTTSVLNRLKSNSQSNHSDKIEAKGEEDEFDENFDPIDQVMLKAYEEEENLVLEIEKVQNKELLSVIAQEAKLTKQLSAEKLMHFNHHKYQKQRSKKNHDEGNEKNSKMATDYETFEMNEKKRQRKLNNVFWENYKTDDDLNYKLNDLNNDDFESEMETIRTPGRALQMHEKLLSMSRKASPNERRRKHEEKQARAQEKREQFYQDRSKKLRELTKKIEEVRELKKKLLKVKKATMKAKLQRAEEKRQYLLRLKANKAAVEEQKAHEIAFINNLVAQNRKHDILERYEKKHEAIKHNLEEERIRKQEEQKAKEHAAELRRKELETQRMTKLKEMLEKRRIKQSKIEQTQLEKEKERIETAKAKERTREMRLAIIEAQFQANKQEVKKRIIQKQEEWSRRHESNLEEIRKKAFEMSILHFSTEDNQGGDAPTPVPYEKAKYCNVCNVTINTEVQLKSHLRGIKHQQTMNEKCQGKHLTKSEIEEFNLNCIIDSPKETNEKEMIISEERNRAMKKRLKKLKNKILNKGIEYETNKKKQQNNVEPANNIKSKMPKLIKDLEKISNSNENKQTNLDRICGELNRMIVKNLNDQEIFKNNDGLNICVKLLEQICQSANEVHNNSSKTIINIVSLLINAVKNNYEACCDVIMSNKLLSLLDLLNIHSNVMLNEIVSYTGENGSANLSNNFFNSKNTNQKYLGDWMICSSLIQFVGCVFSTINNEAHLFEKSSDLNKIEQNNLTSRANDLLSLITSFGFIDLFSVFFSNIRGPLDDEQQTAEILKNCLNFLISLTKFLALKNSTNVFAERKHEDTTQLIATFKSTNLVNIISMLYGMLHKDASTPVKYDHTVSSAEHVKRKQPSSTLELTTLSLKLLNQMTVLDLNMVQSSLGEESLSLQLRHIASYLIWYLATNKYEDLLHEMILLIGYFTVLNNDNQIKMELGTPPTILQQLCNLPFNYFSDKKLISILYPTLICCCFDNEKNKCVLTTELSSDMLANYIQEQIDEDQKTTNKIQTFNDDKFVFSKRFPNSKWSQAFDYFCSKQ